MRFKVLLTVLAATAIAWAPAAQAQEMGWDEDEEPQRLEQEQWDEAEQGTGPVERQATGITPPPPTTSGEKRLQEFKAVPTGFVKREYVIRQQNLAGKWEKANIFPASNADPRWVPITSVQYDEAKGSGLIDGKLKGTVYGPYYENMVRICKTAPGAEQSVTPPAR